MCWYVLTFCLSTCAFQYGCGAGASSARRDARRSAGGPSRITKAPASRRSDSRTPASAATAARSLALTASRAGPNAASVAATTVEPVREKAVAIATVAAPARRPHAAALSTSSRTHR